MSEASRLRGGEGYEARDDEVTPPRWPLSSWCNQSQYDKSPAHLGGTFLRRKGKAFANSTGIYLP